MNLKEYIPYHKRLLKLAFPLVLTQSGQVVVQLVDNVMVGRVGTLELAASAFANNIFILLMMIGIGIVIGITPLLGHSIGAVNEKEATSIIKNGLLLSLIMAISLTTLSLLISLLMPYMGQPADIIAISQPYFRLLSLSLLPLIIFMGLKQVGEGLGNTFWAMIATISSNIVNIGLNYVLIFGKLGFPELGLNGAGIATLIARIIMPIVLFFGFKTMARYQLYSKLLPTVKYSFKKIKHILNVGFPIAVQMVIELSIFSFGGIMMGWIGTEELAAHQIAAAMTGFTFMIANGVALATTIRVSFQYGAGEIDKMKMASIASVQLTLAYMSVTAFTYISLRNHIPMLFTNDIEVIKQAAPLFVVAGIFQLFDGLQVVCIGILRGLADVKATMITAILAYMFVGMPISYICAFVLDFGPTGIWMGFVAGLGITGIILAIRIKLKWARESKPTVK